MARKSKSEAQPPWRPNFRTVDTLPDIKPIRTDFILNFIGVSLAVVLLSLLAYREFNAQSIGGNIKQLEENIASRQAENRKTIRDAKQFDTISKNIEEVATFLRNNLSPVEVAIVLAEHLPEEMLVASVTVRPEAIVTGGRRNRQRTLLTNILVIGTVQTDREATTIVDDYKNTLAEQPIFKEQLRSIELPVLQRDPQTGLFDYEILIVLNRT